MRKILPPMFFCVLVGFYLSGCAIILEPDVEDLWVQTDADEVYGTCVEVMNGAEAYRVLDSSPEKRTVLAARNSPFLREEFLDVVRLQVLEVEGGARVHIDATRESNAGSDASELAKTLTHPAHIPGPSLPMVTLEVLEAIELRVTNLKYEAHRVEASQTP